MASKRHSLDLFSTSPKTGAFPVRGLSASSDLYCTYSAPYFAFKREGKAYGVSQGCCNHWDCPRCGILRAKQEYGRMVSGIELLAEKHEIFFITLTCRGRGLSVDAATQGYLGWTNRLLDAARCRSKKFDQEWHYVQVTEKQKRGHPHSHILTTFNPMDTYTDWVYSKTYTDTEVHHTYKRRLRSNWLQKTVISAGLGEQYDLSSVRTAKAAARYVAKYMFKSSMFTDDFPKGWKRIRYSQKFPHLQERTTDAFVLLSGDDWRRLATLAVIVTTDNEQTKGEVLYQLKGHDVLVS